MIHEPEMIELERRAHECRISMRNLCLNAGKHPQSWYRARQRGRMEYKLFKPLEDAIKALEEKA